MGEKKCPHCAMAIPMEAKVCPYCRKKFDSMLPTLFIALFFGFLIIVALAAIAPTPNKSSSTNNNEKPQITTDQREFIDNMVAQNNLEVEAIYNKAFISPIIWNQMDVQTQKNFAIALAIYCRDKQINSHIIWVDIYDAKAGKKLATYNDTMGIQFD